MVTSNGEEEGVMWRVERPKRDCQIQGAVDGLRGAPRDSQHGRGSVTRPVGDPFGRQGAEDVTGVDRGTCFWFFFLFFEREVVDVGAFRA